MLLHKKYSSWVRSRCDQAPPHEVSGGVVATGAAVVDQVDEFMALDSELPMLPVVLKNDDEMTVSAETTLIFLNTTYSSAARLSELSTQGSTLVTTERKWGYGPYKNMFTKILKT